MINKYNLIALICFMANALWSTSVFAVELCPGCCGKDPQNPDKRTLVILVHGYNDDSEGEAVTAMEEYLSGNKCLDIRKFDWGERQRSCVDLLSGRLHDAVVDALYDSSEQYCSIFIAAHSAGGIIASDLFRSGNPLGDTFSDLEGLDVEVETYGSPFGGFGLPKPLAPVADGGIPPLYNGEGCFFSEIGTGFGDMGSSHESVTVTHYTHPQDGNITPKSQRGGISNADKVGPVPDTDHLTIVGEGLLSISTCCLDGVWCTKDSDCTSTSDEADWVCNQDSGCCEEDRDPPSPAFTGGDDPSHDPPTEPTSPMSPTGEPENRGCTSGCHSDQDCSVGESCVVFGTDPSDEGGLVCACTTTSPRPTPYPSPMSTPIPLEKPMSGDRG